MPSYVQRFNDIVRRLVGSAGEEPLHQIGPELLSAIILENDRPENFILGGARLYSGFVSVAASVGNFTTIVLSGAAGDYVNVVVAWWLRDAQVCNFGIRAGSGFTPTSILNPRDTRQRGGFAARFFFRQTAAQLLSADPRTEFISGTPYRINPVSMVLSGQTSQGTPCWETQVVNTGLSVYIVGYERPADPQELDASVV